MSSDRLHRLGLGLIAEKALAGERLSTTDGERLFACPEPLAVGALAHAVRRGRHGSAVYFVVNRHLNYSNVCVNRCRFCAFRRDEGEEGAFTHDLEALLAKLTAMPEARLSEIHVVGGCHPSLPLSFFEELLRRVREVRPKAVLKCFTAAEIAHLARLEGISAAEVLSRLKAAGLDMLAGGGAEIFAPEVRGRICPEKVTGEDWLAIHAAAHGLGLRSTAPCSTATWRASPTAWSTWRRSGASRTEPAASPASSPCPTRPRPTGWAWPTARAGSIR